MGRHRRKGKTVKVGRLPSSTTRSDAASGPYGSKNTGRCQPSLQTPKASAPGRTSLGWRAEVLQSPLRVETFNSAGGDATVAGCRSRVLGGMAAWTGKRARRRQLASLRWRARHGETAPGQSKDAKASAGLSDLRGRATRLAGGGAQRERRCYPTTRYSGRRARACSWVNRLLGGAPVAAEHERWVDTDGRERP